MSLKTPKKEWDLKKGFFLNSFITRISRGYKNIYNYSWILLLLSFVLLSFSITNGILDFNLFLNSDALYLQQIFRAFFVDKINFSYWHFPDAPFFFPDFAVYSLFRVISGNFVLSNILTSILMFVLLILAFIKVFDYMEFSNRKSMKGALMIIASIYTLLLAQGLPFIDTVLFLSPVWHEGELLISLLLVILLFETIKMDRPVIYLLIFLLTTLTVISDKYFLKDAVLPLFFSFFFISLIDFKYIKKLYKFYISLLIGTLTGNFLYKSIVPSSKSYGEAVPWLLNNWRGFKSVFYDLLTSKVLSINVATKDTFFNNYMRIYFPIIILMVFVAIMYVLYKVCKVAESPKNRPNNVNLIIFSTVTFAQFGFGIIATLLYGTFSGTTHLRYVGSIFIFPPFLLLIFIFLRFERFISKYSYLITIILLSFYVLLTARMVGKASSGGFLNIFRYKPPDSECIDKLVKEKDLKYGLGNFWNSTPNSLFSKEGAIVHPIRTDLQFIEASPWLSSSQMYINNKHQYILVEDLDEQVIESELGAPTEIIQCPTTDIYVYDSEKSLEIISNRFKAKLFHQVLEDSNNVFSINAVDFPSFASRPYDLVNEKINYQITNDGFLIPEHNSGKGYFTEGPVVYLKGGTYIFDLVYVSDENLGFFDIYKSESKKLIRTNFENTNGNLFSHKVTVVSDIETGEYVGFFPYYSGEGSVSLEKLIVSQIN